MTDDQAIVLMEIVDARWHDADIPDPEAMIGAAVRAALDRSEGCPPVDDETAVWFLRDRRMDAEAGEREQVPPVQF